MFFIIRPTPRNPRKVRGIPSKIWKPDKRSIEEAKSALRSVMELRVKKLQRDGKLKNEIIKDSAKYAVRVVTRWALRGAIGTHKKIDSNDSRKILALSSELSSGDNVRTQRAVIAIFGFLSEKMTNDEIKRFFDTMDTYSAILRH